MQASSSAGPSPASSRSTKRPKEKRDSTAPPNKRFRFLDLLAADDGEEEEEEAEEEDEEEEVGDAGDDFVTPDDEEVRLTEHDFINDSLDEARERAEAEAEAEHAQELAAGIVERHSKAYGKGKQREVVEDDGEEGLSKTDEYFLDHWQAVHGGDTVGGYRTFKMKIKFGKAKTAAEQLLDVAHKKTIPCRIFALDVDPNFIYIQANQSGLLDLRRFLAKGYVNFTHFIQQATFLVPADEVPALLRTTISNIYLSTDWVRVIRGTYGGDVAFLVGVESEENLTVKIACVPRLGGRGSPRKLMDMEDVVGEPDVYIKDRKEYMRGLHLYVVKIQNLKPLVSPPLIDLMPFLESKAGKVITKDIAARLLQADDRVKIIAGDFVGLRGIIVDRNGPAITVDRGDGVPESGRYIIAMATQAEKFFEQGDTVKVFWGRLRMVEGIVVTYNEADEMVTFFNKVENVRQYLLLFYCIC
ncbi:hypothetical protein BD410DRAFT_847102 [Rickenella mellea]|uniref:KOW domain-containing protein n=1 Tax=Rickenella mellea TaxID=50990 RepID=A0A4Y7PE19_9AGAM|nr:hypothetical protein BD410DRAFT_847102 [Rickenella mellea]